MKFVDLNCDMGESFGAWQMGDDAAVMPLITSANIACGFHAGDPEVMRRTVALAAEHGVAIGAHVSLPDLQGFGRREMSVPADEVFAMTLYQLGALAAIAHAAHGMRLSHVKPHGALYNMAAKRDDLADAIASAIECFDARLVLFGLAGSRLIAAGKSRGLSVANEVFADRSYEADGALTPRTIEGAVLHDPAEAARRAVRMVVDGTVVARTGETIRLQADTICLHGDGANPAGFAHALRAALIAAGVSIRAIDPSAAGPAAR